ncbi:MAG: hypothetical protein IJL80_09425, partial [Treponema sp.]|nr:hypothetical protein [Treponema sp.]
KMSTGLYIYYEFINLTITIIRPVNLWKGAVSSSGERRCEVEKQGFRAHRFSTFPQKAPLPGGLHSLSTELVK